MPSSYTNQLKLLYILLVTIVTDPVTKVDAPI